LIVDEVSTIDTRIIALLHHRLQQVMDNKLPFGGLPIVFVGDFNQLGPVRKTFIPSSMTHWAT
jgi:ATP-dependent DNA helicase PIF1